MIQLLLTTVFIMLILNIYNFRDIYLNGKYDSDSGSDLNGEDGSESEGKILWNA